MPTFTNIRGTSEPHFRISLSGPTIYHGTADPVITPPTPLGGGTLNPGDLYVRTGGTAQGLHVLGTGGDNDWNEFLETGAAVPVVIGGDLTVKGEFDTWDDIITMNSDAAALIGNLGGIEVARLASPTVQWVWDDSLLHWKPYSSAVTDSLHNVAVGNNLIVGGTVAGRLTAPNGLSTSPGIRFSTAGVGVYSDGTILGFSTASTGRWSIDASGNLLPATTHDIGATGALAGSVYATLVAGDDGAVGTPTFTFDSDTTTGLYHDAGAIVLSSGGSEVARVDATETELQGTLKLTDGTSWTIDNDGADSNKLKFAHSTTDYAILTTGGELLIGDGALATPAYSFISDDSAGMYLDTGDIKFTLDGISQHLVITPTAINAPTATVTNAQDLVTKAYVDGATGGSWREPVVVKEDINYLNLAAAEAAMNGGTVDGISMTTGDRILYTDIGGENKNVFIINGTVGAGATLVEDTNTITVGDTVYVNEGTHAGKVFSYDVALTWTEISGAGGGGSTMYFDYESQTAIALQTVFNLASVVYAPTVDGSRLQVYVNGVKQVFGGGAAYVETDETTVTFNVAPGVGKTVEFYAVGLATVDGILSQETQTGFTGLPNPITFTSITYAVGQAGLLVYLNGQKMVGGTAYTELTSTTIQWLAPALVPGDILEFYSSVPIVAGVNLDDISNVSNVAPLNNDQLTYNTIAGEWQPVAAGSVGNGLLFDEDGNGLVGVIDGINAVFTTTDVAVQAKTGGPGKRSYQQVFVNGVLQEEGILPRDYVAGPPNTITFNVGKLPQPGDTIVVYQL